MQKLVRFLGVITRPHHRSEAMTRCTKFLFQLENLYLLFHLRVVASRTTRDLEMPTGVRNPHSAGIFVPSHFRLAII